MKLGLPEAYSLFDGRFYYAPYEKVAWTFEQGRGEAYCRLYDVAGGVAGEAWYPANPIQGVRAGYRVFNEPDDPNRIRVEATLTCDSNRQEICLSTIQPCLELRGCPEFASDGNLYEFISRCFVATDKGVQRMNMLARRNGANGHQRVQWHVVQGKDRRRLAQHSWGVSDVQVVLPWVGVENGSHDLAVMMMWENAAFVGQGYIDCLHCDPDVMHDQDGREHTYRGTIWVSDRPLDELADEAKAILAHWRGNS